MKFVRCDRCGTECELNKKTNEWSGMFIKNQVKDLCPNCAPTWKEIKKTLTTKKFEDVIQISNSFLMRQ